MAKIVHNNFNDTINEMLTEAKNRGIIHLSFDGENWEGNTMLVDNHKMVNFGTCGYLGLETHPKLIENTVKFAHDFGVQFSVSRAYLKTRHNQRLEELLSQIFLGKKVIAFSSTTVTHIAVIPIVVEQNDLIILDQQAHISMQTAAQLMASKGVDIEMVRHSNLEMLENKLRVNRNKYNKIWYMIDGVYSMYGDVAPIDDINKLMQEYEQLNLYVDDAHGMSWSGKNGCGRIFEKTIQNGRTIYVSTLAKGFGTMGGTVVFPNDELYNKVILHGGPLSYSHPIPPPMMGASIASAEIHLSDEIYDLQQKLRSRLKLASAYLENTNLPVMSSRETPIFFIGTGQPNVGYNLNKRVLQDGFYVNIGMFPAVPVKNTGVRFTITNHNSEEEIKDLVATIERNFPLALNEEGRTLNNVRKAFRLPPIEEKAVEVPAAQVNLKVEYYETVKDFSKEEWDECFYGKGNFDWSSMDLLEKSFSGNEKEEENWSFHYIIIRDSSKNAIVAAAPFTGGIFKDDLVSPPNISRKIEEKRSEDPYYLCSRMLMMGSLLSEGEHLYLDKANNRWEMALKLLLAEAHKIQENMGLNGIILRDFDEDEREMSHIFFDSGFFPVKMPDSNIIFDLQRNKDCDYIELLSKRNRKNVRQDVLRFTSEFKHEVKKQLNKEELEVFYNLYTNVAEKNLDVNLFKYPHKLFEMINVDPNWEFFLLRRRDKDAISAILCAYKTKDAYFPILIGINYKDNNELNAYKQIVYRTVLHAREVGYSRVHLGITADIEKRKVGAQQSHKKSFMYITDQFNLEILGIISD